MSFTDELTVGVARLLHDAGIATWRDSGAYQAGETGITIRVVPSTPARVVTLSTYGVDDGLGPVDSTIGLQVRTRWDGKDPRPVDALDDAVYELLHDRTDYALPNGVRVDLSRRTSFGSLGQDGSGLWANTSNYYLTMHRPPSST